MDTAIAAAHSGIAHVYNWDFGLNKWVNFASGNKTSRIIIIERKKEFFVQVMPEDSTNQKFEYFLPADVQVTKTRDMIQFPVPDKRDATGGKLIAVRFKQHQLEAQFTSTASGKIRGFSLPLRASQSEHDDKLAPEEMFSRKNEFRDETFHVERLKDNYQPPTLPASTLPGKPVPPPNGGIEISQQPYQPPVMPSHAQYHPPQRPPVNNEAHIFAHRGGPPPDVRNVSNPKPFSGENKLRLIEHSNNDFQFNDREMPPAPLNNLNVENPGFNDRVQNPPFANDAVRRGHDKRSGEMDRSGFQDPRGGLPQVEGRERGYPVPMGRPDPGRMDRGGYNVPQGGPDLMHPGRGDGGGYHVSQGGLDQMHPKRMDGVGHMGPRGEASDSVYHRGMMREDTRGYDDRGGHNPLYHGGPGVGLNQRGGHYRQEPNHGYQPEGRRLQDNLRGPTPMFYKQGEAPNNPYYKDNMGQLNDDLGPTPRKYPMASHRPIPNPTVKPFVEPLQKPAPPPTRSVSEADIEDINHYSQRLAESITSGNTVAAKELVNYLVELVKDSSLTSSICGSFSFKQEEQEQEKTFCLEVIVEPLNGPSYPIYLEVQSSFTIEYLKVECQKRFKIPRECQYWVVGSQLAEDKKTLKELNIDDSCTTYIYIQHPHKAKVSKNDLVAIKLRQEQKRLHSNPDQTQVPMTGRSLEPPTMSHPNPDPVPMEPLNDSRAVFRSPGPLGVLMPPVPPPHGGVQTMPNEHPGIAHQINQNNDQLLVIDSYDGQDQEYVLKEKPPSLLPKQKVGWKCDICTFQNKPYRPGCEMCGSDRPQDYVPPHDYVPTEDERKFLDSDIHGFEEVSHFLEMERQKEKEQAQENYLKLLNTDVVPVVTNEEEFECPVCYNDIDPGDGIRLRGCLHMVCKDCLQGTVVHCEESEVKCPFIDGDAECQEPISEREIRAVLTDEELQAFHSRALRQAEASDPKSFHCKTPDCKGFCFYEDEVNEFQCQICQHTNCILCNAQHEEMNCQQYQNDIKAKAANDEAARQTQEMLENMVKEGEAMHCPNCKIIVTKKIGCDWIRCSMCKTEMCWATKGPRWGPKGRGDITGGCKCGVNRQKCHPDCRNCH